MGSEFEAAGAKPTVPALYLVATPIGNLGDITLRALETLRLVDVVAAEDTRVTGRLLKHYGIRKPLISFFEHNQQKATETVIEHVRAGRSVALVTTAGTPGIADPGYTAVRRAIVMPASSSRATSWSSLRGWALSSAAMISWSLALTASQARSSPSAVVVPPAKNIRRG